MGCGAWRVMLMTFEWLGGGHCWSVWVVGIAGACGVRLLGVRECWAWGRWCEGRGDVGCFVYLEGADREIRCMMGGMTCREYGWGECCGDGEVDV